MDDHARRLTHVRCFVCSHVFDGSRPVLYVSRKYDETDPADSPDWCFLCGGEDHEQSADSFSAVGMGHVVGGDPTLEGVLDLGPNGEAERTEVGGAWVRTEPSSEPCALCGRTVREHQAQPRFRLPDEIAALPDGDATPGLWMTHGTPEDSVMMTTADDQAFLRCILPVRLIGGSTVQYGVWIAVSLADLEFAHGVWWEPSYADLRLSGKLANAVPPWGLFGSVVEVTVLDPEQTPYCTSTSDPELGRVVNEEWDHDSVLSAVGF